MAASSAFAANIVRIVRNASPPQIVVTAAIALVIRWVFKAFQRAYFHPLSRFPGPKLCAVTHLPKLYALYRGQSHQYLHKLHQRYGEVVRLAPEELSFIHPDAWRDIYGHGVRGSQGSVPPKYWAWYGKMDNGVDHMITAKGMAHPRMRNIFSPAFSDRALKEQEPLFMKYIDQLLRNLKQDVQDDPDGKFDMVRNYNFTTFDVMGDLTFGEPLHMLDNATYSPWVSAIFGGIKFNSRLRALVHIPWLANTLIFILSKSLAKQRRDHFQHSVDRVSKRLENGRASAGTDLWDFVLKQEGRKVLTRDEMDSHSSLFMIAGTETTATLLSGVTYLLLKNPDKMHKLVNEIRGAFSSEEDMSMETIAALPYLTACLKEGLRLYPPVPSGLPHLTPANGSTICGEYVPASTVVSVPQFATYRSEQNFREPESFSPERWLGDERFANDRKAAHQPFSVGSRDCLGKNMAYHEMRLILTKVLYNFDCELCEESEGWINQKTFTLWEKHPLMVKLRAVHD